MPPVPPNKWSAENSAQYKEKAVKFKNGNEI